MDGKILLVDDDEAIRKLLTRRLTRAGFDVHTAANGEEGIDMAFELRPNLILMDMQMPVMDGITAIQTLRERGYRGLIAMLTAMAATIDQEKAAQVGCDYFITKPIKADFEKTLDSILKGASDGQSSSR